MSMFETINSKTLKEQKKIKKKTLGIILFLILFSNSALRSEEHLQLYIGIAMFVCLYAFFLGLQKPSRITSTIFNSFSIWTMVLFFIYFFYGIVLPSNDFFNTDYFLFMFVMILITIMLFVDIPIALMMEIFVKVCAFSSIAVCLFILINEWSLIISGGTRIGESGSGNVNTIATYLGIMSIPCIYKVIFDNKYIYFVPYGLSTILMLMTGSKKALLYIILGVVILAVFKNKMKLQKYIFPLIMLIVVIFLIFNNEFLYNIIGARTIDFFAGLGFNIEGAHYSNSTALRLLMYKLSYEAFLSKPIFGGGWFYFSTYSGLGTYSHNNYLEMLTNYGLVGFMIYYSMFLSVLVRLFRLTREDNSAKLLFTILLIIVLSDAAAVSFSYNLFNYLVLVVGYLYLKNMQKEKYIITKGTDD